MLGGHLTSLLAAVAVIALAAQALGAVARRLGQPPVLGEIVAGIAAGPSCFGGAIGRHLLPADVRPLLAVLADVGLVLFMFCVGLELDGALLRRRRRVVTAVSLGSIAVPIVLGACLALALAGAHAGAHPAAFVAFMAAAMAVTAFPVLARILADHWMLDGEVGQTALACAAVNDVVAWLLLAVAVVVAGAGGHAAWRLAALVPYVVLVLGAVRPLLRRLARAGVLDAQRSARVVALVGAAVLLSAAATSWMGLTPVLGAFLLGAALPHELRATAGAVVARSVEPLSRGILLPVFFVVAGLRVDLGLAGGHALAELALILVVAVAGKFGGTFVAACWAGAGRAEAAALGSLMNARGLTELVMLTVGLQLGVLDGATYSVMVVMALVTTAMTGPLLRVVRTLEGTSRPRPTPPRAGGIEPTGAVGWTARAPASVASAPWAACDGLPPGARPAPERLEPGRRAFEGGMGNPTQAPTAVTNLVVAMFTTADQDAALAWYTEKLGFELRVDVRFGPDGENRWPWAPMSRRVRSSARSSPSCSPAHHCAG